MNKRLRRLRLVAASVFTLAIAGRPALGQSVAGFAAELGLTAESMVVAGAHPAGALNCLSLLESADAFVRDALIHQRQAVDAAATEVAGLAAVVLREPSDHLLQTYHTALQDLTSAKELLHQIRIELFAFATQNASPQQIERLVTWRHVAKPGLPAEFCVRERPAQEWKAIKRAVCAERRAAATGQALAEAHAELLAQVRGEPLVAQAAANLEVHLDAVRAIFDQFDD